MDATDDLASATVRAGGAGPAGDRPGQPGHGGLAADRMALAVLSFTAAWLLRRSANMPALNDDGLPGFSANDCLAPVVTWVTVTLYIDLRGQSPGAALRRARAAAALLAFAVNVPTI